MVVKLLNQQDKGEEDKMANIKTKHGGFEDLGTFKRRKTIKVMGSKVVDVEFSQGKLTILEDELRRIMEGK